MKLCMALRSFQSLAVAAVVFATAGLAGRPEDALMDYNEMMRSRESVGRVRAVPEQSMLVQTTLGDRRPAEADLPAECVWGVADQKVIVPEVDPSDARRSRPDHGYGDLPVYVITLGDHDRRAKNAACLGAELAAQSIPELHFSAESFPAVVGSQINWEGVTAKGDVASHMRLKSGEVGAYLSHVEAWRKMLQSGAEWALVLEDDASIASDLVPHLLPVLDDLPSDWDILWLFESQAVKLNAHFNRPPTPLAGKAHVLKKNHGIGLDGYLISSRGAKMLLQLVLPINEKPIDLVLHELVVEDRVRAYLSNPPLVYDDFKQQSVIQHRYYDELKGLSRRPVARPSAVKVDTAITPAPPVVVGEAKNEGLVVNEATKPKLAGVKEAKKARKGAFGKAPKAVGHVGKKGRKSPAHAKKKRASLAKRTEALQGNKAELLQQGGGTPQPRPEPKTWYQLLFKMAMAESTASGIPQPRGKKEVLMPPSGLTSSGAPKQDAPLPVGAPSGKTEEVLGVSVPPSGPTSGSVDAGPPPPMQEESDSTADASAMQGSAADGPATQHSAQPPRKAFALSLAAHAID